MKIAAVQLKSFKGDILQNIQHHLYFIHQLIEVGVDLIVFPELSITGYEPELANDLALSVDDYRFDIFQNTVNQHITSIGVGFPVKGAQGIHIGMALFQPNKKREIYYKKFLHPDEYPFFQSGQNHFSLINESPAIAPAICYEISVDAHIERAVALGADIYLASVAKFVNGIPAARQRLSTLARQYAKTVIMANGVGKADGALCGGKSSIWNQKGELMGELDDQEEGYLILDTETGKVLRS